jgi:hypothetical protein
LVKIDKVKMPFLAKVKAKSESSSSMSRQFPKFDF